ncbi:hypothetical protein [Natranaeroarchaeum aerophilus]|uniref:Uncharacterized protein n=1 Tax=Natranaeroarchaeum aerophilus TaxID=2917711 RepID=A0AAE3K8N8_9EURY|nr:hypothetical protein [Natranaeroarchaeum aerophilus]MCL9815174.1 hypothetical protein [Natranaeroarchaeum aerophilus]
MDEFTRGETATGSGPAASETQVFGELQNEVDELSPAGLVQDPEYLEFLDSHGELEMTEDSVSLDDLLGEDADSTNDSQSKSTNGGPEQQRDGKQRIEPTEGEEDSDGVEGQGVPINVDTLITALEDEDVTDSKRAKLRNALGIRDNRQVEVQLNYLKSRFLDLEAYLQAMEDLFDTDTDLLEEVDELHAELARLRNDMAAQRDRLDQLEADIETLRNDSGRHEGELATIERRLDETNEMIEQNLSAIEAELNTARQWRENVESAFQTAQPE